MSTLELRTKKQGMGAWKSEGEDSHHEALPGFHALTLKEKCLYLVKISKRNTRHQSLAVMGLALLALAVNHLLIAV